MGVSVFLHHENEISVVPCVTVANIKLAIDGSQILSEHSLATVYTTIQDRTSQVLEKGGN